MKKKVSGQEKDTIKQIESIDYKEDAFEIMEDPAKYFELYFKNVHTPTGKILAHFSVLSLLRRLDTSEELAQKTSDYFLDKYTVPEWLDKLMGFYNYGISIMNYLLDNHDNVILDMYNDKLINKKTMEKGMKSFQTVQKTLKTDKEALGKCIVDMEEEKRRAQDYLE